MALLLFSGNSSLGLGSKKFGAPTPAGFGAAMKTAVTAAGFVYLAEESPLIPGGPSHLISFRVSENGATQAAEIIDDEVARFDESQVDAKKIFALLAPMMGKQFVVRKRSATTQIDGLYPSFLRVFFRYRETQTGLYADLANAAPASLSAMIEEVHATASTPASRPSQSVFLQSALLDKQTVTEFRRDHLLKLIMPNELNSAPVTAAALQQPFKLIATSEDAILHDSLAAQLTSKQPVLDIEYGDTAFQLRSLKPRN